MKLQLFVLAATIFAFGCGIQVAETSNAKSSEINAANLDASETPKKIKKQIFEEPKTDKPTETKMAEQSNLISMTAKAEKTGGKLIVEYEIENHSDKQLYLWDKIIGYNEKGQFISNDLAYVMFEEPATIRVVRANLQLPFDRDVARKEIPFARILEAKAKVTGKIILDSPTKEYSPFYKKLNDENPKIEKCKTVRLLIGWSILREGMQIQERKVGDETVLAIRGGWKEPYHKLLEQKIAIDADLQVYRDAFDRNMPFQ